MKIRSQLTLLFSLITGGLLLIFALFIYFSAASDRREASFTHIRGEAMIRAKVLLEWGVEAAALQAIYLQSREMQSGVEVAIYDSGFNLLYHDAEELDFVQETPRMIQDILSAGELRFVQEGWEVLGIAYHHEGEDYVLTAAAYDHTGRQGLMSLLWNLSLAWVVAVLITFVAGWYFAGRVLRPVSRMAEKAGEISASHMHLRLGEGRGQDELAGLAMTFNKMLDRLEDSFDAQREFVSNVAHELRTPLSAISGEVELALSRKDLPEQIREAFTKLLQDVRRLSRLSTGLMDLAKSSYEAHQVSLGSCRLDEEIMEARRELLREQPDYRISIQLDEQLDDEDAITVKANPYLLRLALANLMENACKFSEDRSARVILKTKGANGAPAIMVEDSGVGIAESDLPKLFKPFFRGSNSGMSEGSGIGLSLVQRIMRLHQVDLQIDSRQGEGTRVHLEWKRTGRRSG